MAESINNFYQGKKVFVTGHTGFKGAWLITWLMQLGAQVKGYALEPDGSNALIPLVLEKGGFENVYGDVRDKAKLQQEIQNFQPDVVFHLAAQALVRRSYEIPSETFDINVVGTCNLLEALRQVEKKCTAVIVTTDKVYENREINYHYKEEDVLGGYDPYSASKAACEIAVASFRNSFFNRKQYHVHHKSIVCARAGNVIGGSDFSENRIVPDIVRALQNKTSIEVRNPNAVRPWQHVLEPLGGYLTLAKQAYENYERVSNAYNFGPNEADHLPVKSLVEKAITNWGKGEWLDTFDPNSLHEAGLLQLDISKAKGELNWNPKLDSATAIEWTINWYRKTSDILEFTNQQIQQYQSL